MTEATDHGDYGPCERGQAPQERHQHFLHWTPDGSHLVFDQSNTVWALDIENSELRNIARVYRGQYALPDGFHADVSPDGTRVVYSTCEFTLIELPPPLLENYAGKAFYEIALVNVDGTERRRLTETARFDGYPAWSPDGAHVAFAATTYPEGDSPTELSMRYFPEAKTFVTTQLAIMAVETSELRWLDSTSRVALHAPVWSPDGQLLAFIAFEGEDYSDDRALYTIGVDGAELSKVSELSKSRKTTAAPTWSPDGEKLAFAAVEGEEAGIYVVRPDGSGQREVWRSGADGPSTPISQVSWSPDGTEVLFVSDRVYVVGADGSDPRPLSPALPDTTLGLDPNDELRDVGAVRVAWSPDGSRVAVYYPRREDYSRATRSLLVTVAADGSDLRTLAGAHEDDRDLRLLNPPHTDRSVDLAACSAGVVVPDPEENPGLVRDCEVLLSIRDRLAADARLNWNEHTPIAGWQGVFVDGEPARVLTLSLQGIVSLNGRPLSGTLPPELGLLSELRELTIPGSYLSGGIPPELGTLSKLRHLRLHTNFLTGSIPSELGRLTQLERLDLGFNFLSGCIPVELPELWVRQSGLEWCAE